MTTKKFKTTDESTPPTLCLLSRENGHPPRPQKSTTAVTYIAKSPWERNRSLLATSAVPGDRKRKKEMNKKKKEKRKWYYRHVITATDGGRALTSLTSTMMCQLFSFSPLDDASKRPRRTEAQRQHRHPRHQSPYWERLTYRQQQYISKSLKSVAVKRPR